LNLSRVVQGLTLHTLKLVMKINQRRNKRRASDTIDSTSLQGSNVLYVLLDPHAEWITQPLVLQSEAMLEMQIMHSKDVLAQCMAVRALAALVATAARGIVREDPGAALRGQPMAVSLHAAYQVLVKTLRNREIFCRCGARTKIIWTDWLLHWQICTISLFSLAAPAPSDAAM
jgi:hypothetical protein